MSLPQIANECLIARSKYLRGGSLRCRCLAAICAVLWLPAFSISAQSVAGNPTPDAPAIATESSDSASALLLGAGDLLDVQVFDTPELSEKLRVGESGAIILPVGGAVGVRGLT